MKDHLASENKNPLIPKIIHISWPHDSWCHTFDVCLDSIHRMHPDWEIRFYRRDDLPYMHNQDVIDKLLDEHDNLFIANAFIGMQLIVENGGVALDIDSYMFRNLDPLIASTRRGVIMRHFRFHGTHFMACAPHDEYFTRAICAMPDVYGHINTHCIPNDIFTAAKLLQWIETCDSSIKINMRPTMFNCLHLPEYALLHRYVVEHLKPGEEMPSYVRGIRMIQDGKKYHNVTYGEGTRTMLEHAEANREKYFRVMDDAGIIYR